MKLSVSFQRIALILLCFLFSLTELMAAVVSESSASRIAGDFVFWNSGSRAGSGTLRLAHVVKSGGADRIYIYNVDGGGWVMVSGDDNTRRQVLGYSPTGRFDYSAMPVNARSWIESYADVISRLESHPEYIRRDSVMQSRASGAVAPLLGEIAWDQGEPYNLLCPTLSNGERAVTGCVATAMAQVMMYHRYPAAGQGRVSYEWNGQTLSADFGKYDWDLMVQKYTGNESEASRQAVATLMRDCGYSVKMDYGPGSGADFNSAFSALVEKFNYDKSLIYLSRNMCDTESWERILKEELDNKRPVLYSGTGNGASHAFVCDGYDDKGYFHFNWGWSGANDGYYLTGEHSFPYNQAIIYGIQPDFSGKGNCLLLINNFDVVDNKVIIEGSFLPSYKGDVQIEIGYALENKSDGSVTIRSLDNVNVIQLAYWSNFSPAVSGLQDGEYILYPMFRIEGEKDWKKTLFLPGRFPDAADRYIELTVKDGIPVLPDDIYVVDGLYFKKESYGWVVFDAEIGETGELVIPSKVKIDGDVYKVESVSLNGKDNLKTLVNSSPRLSLSLWKCPNLKTIQFGGIELVGSCNTPNLETIFLTENLYNYSLNIKDTKVKEIEFPTMESGLQITGSSFPDFTKIYFHSSVPPTINGDVGEGLEFHVPSGTKDIYLSAGFGKMGSVIEEENIMPGKYGIEWGMNGGVIPNIGGCTGLFVSSEKYVEFAIKFNESAAQTYKGKKITAINFYLMESLTAIPSYVFISNSDTGYITKQSVEAMPGINNRIVLNEPYTITGEPIYIGIGDSEMLDIFSSPTDYKVYDHFYARHGGDYNICNIVPNMWVDCGNKVDWSPLPITVTIEGDDMPAGVSILNMEIEGVNEKKSEDAVSVKTMAVDNTDGEGIYYIKSISDGGKRIEKVIEEDNVVVPSSRAAVVGNRSVPEVRLFGDSCRVNVFLQNRSLEKISSFKLHANAGTRTFDKDFNYSLAVNQSAKVSLSFPIKDLEDSFECKASVDEFNGRSNEIPDDGNTTVLIMNYSQSEKYPLIAVAEKASSAMEYDYTEAGLKELEEEWPDNYIEINIHYNDEMANPENYESFSRMIHGFPRIVTNRMKNRDSYIVNTNSTQPQMSSFFKENSDKATESVKITKAVTNGEECEVSAVVSTAYPADGKSFALAFVVVEDQVGPYPKQCNTGKMDENNQWIIETRDELFDNVARGIYGEFNGMTSLLPEKMATNASYPVTYSFTMPKNIQNLDNTKIVALLLDESQIQMRLLSEYSVIANADRMKLEVDRNMSGVDEVTEDADDIIKVEGNRIYTTVSCERFEVFTIDGKRTVSENLAKGFYVARAVVNGRTYVKKVVI